MATKPYGAALNDHLAKYKKTCLKTPEPGFWVHKGELKEYPHILPKHLGARNLLPTNRDLCQEYLKAQVPEITLHKFFHHLNSSQAMCLNLFFPFVADNGKLMPILLNVLGLPSLPVKATFEKVFDPDENTNFDFYLENAGQPCTFFELKLSEAEFGKAQKKRGQTETEYKEKYSDKLELFYRKPLMALVAPKWLEFDTYVKHYQILRNISYVGLYPGSWLFFVVPEANDRLREGVKTIREIISPKLSERVTIRYLEELLEDLLDSAKRTGNHQLVEHFTEFKAKYII